MRRKSSRILQRAFSWIGSRQIITALCLILISPLAAETGTQEPFSHEVNEEVGLSRLFVQMVTNNEQTVLERFDRVMLQLQRAYVTDGTLQKKDLLKVVKGIRWVAEQERYGGHLLDLLCRADTLLSKEKVRNSDQILALLLPDEESRQELNREEK